MEEQNAVTEEELAAWEKLTFPRHGDDTMFFYAIIGAILFVPPTVIAFRNTRFCMPLRILFAVTVVPIFAALMAANYFFIADYFPGLVEQFQSVPEEAETTTYEVILAFVLTCPLAVAGCALWYFVLKYIDRYCAGN